MSTSVNDKLFPRVSRRIVQSTRVNNAPVVISVNYIVTDLEEKEKKRKKVREGGKRGESSI